MEKLKLNILHIYPNLLNLYGDKGNIECLKNRLLWRGIDVEVKSITSEDDVIDFENTDLIFIGGGSDVQQKEALDKLLKYKDDFKAYVESGKSLLAVCGGYSMITKTLSLCGEDKEGLGIINLESKHSDNKRVAGNIILKTDLFDGEIVGFENHDSFIINNEYKYLGTVLTGSGSDAESKTEGVIYKNLIATFLHGPLLPKNPKLCDYIVFNALKHKYSDFECLTELDDTLENMANNYIVRTYSK